MTDTSTKPVFCCSFCGLSQHEVAYLVAGPAMVFICDWCVNLCVNIVGQMRADRAAQEKLAAEAQACAGCKPEPLHGH